MDARIKWFSHSCLGATENKEEIKKRVGWAGRVTDVLRKIFAGGGAGNGINESNI